MQDQPIKVLIIEDNPGDARLLQEFLSQKGSPRFEVTHADQLSAGLKSLTNALVDAIVLDLGLPDSQGLETLLGLQPHAKDTPVIVLTGLDDQDLALQALKMGAQDYLLKSYINQFSLPRAINYAIERRKIETALKESERKYRYLFDSSPVGICIVDLAGNVLDANQEIQDITGYTLAEARTLGIASMYANPHDRLKLLKALHKNGEISEWESGFKRQDGSSFDGLVNAALIDLDGQKVVYCTLRDITAAKRAEARIQHLNQVLRAVRDVNQLITHEHDPQTLLDKACRILLNSRDYSLAWVGLPYLTDQRLVPSASAGPQASYLDHITITLDESPTGQGPAGIAARTHQASVCQDIASDPNFTPWRARALQHGFHSTVAVPMLHHARLYGVLAVYSNQADAFNQEEVDLLSEVANDLAFALQTLEEETRRMQAEEEVHYQANLVASVSDAIIATDLDYIIRSWNLAAEDMFGRNAGDAIGHRINEFLQLPFQDIPTEKFLQVIANKGAWKSEMLQNLKNGAQISLITSISRLTNRAGEPIGYVSVTRDISDLKKAEQTLKAYAEHLEEMVAQRTRELLETQEKLVRKEKLAVVGQLAGSVAHELRNPLAVINNSVYYLKMILKAPDQDTWEYLEMLSTEVRAAESIISDLLDFSRTRSPVKENISITSLVEQVLQKVALPTQVELAKSLPADLPDVWVDPLQIEQVLDNLVRNAFDAMPDGGRLTISASLAPASMQGSPPMLAISFSDTGCGIPPENMNRLFEPLFTTKMHGIGLGLPLSKNLVESNDGNIQVSSQLDKGTTFIVTLPAAAEGSSPPSGEGPGMEE
jgi:PAS domain S-box-containing protein